MAYLLRRGGITGLAAKSFKLAYRLQLLRYMQADLCNPAILSLTESELRLLQLTVRATSYSTVKLTQRLVVAQRAGEAQTEEISVDQRPQGSEQPASADPSKTLAAEASSSTATAPAANEVMQMVLAEIEKAEQLFKAKPCVDAASARPPPLLDLVTGAKAGAAVAERHGLFDHIARTEDLTGKEGAAVAPMPLKAIDFLQIKNRATSLQAAIEALRMTDHICSLTENQSKLVKYPAQLKFAALQHLVFQLLPVPAAVGSDSGYDWAWNTPVTYGTQLDVIFLLQRIMEHFAAAALSLESDRTFFAIRAVGAGVLAAIGDAILRLPATDSVSAFTSALRVRLVWRRRQARRVTMCSTLFIFPLCVSLYLLRFASE